MNIKLAHFTIYGATFFLLAQCMGESDNPLEVDVSDVKIEIEFSRLDRDLFEADTTNLKSFNADMQEKYGQFWIDYAGGILRQGHPADPMFPDNLRSFFDLPYVYDIMCAVDSVFETTAEYDKDIIDGLKHLKFYYPNMVVPDVVYSTNFLNYAGVATDSVLNVGLDFYLGTNHWIVQSLPSAQFADYIKQDMIKEYLVRDALSIWFEANYLGERSYQTMLDAMIFHGKLMYALDAMMPDKAPHEKFKYTKDEMSWAVSNEHRIWLTMVDRDLIHTTNVRDIKRFFDDAPFTAGLKGNEAPDRIGVYLGWEIVHDYMAAHPDMRLPDLIKQTNNDEILRHYKQGEE